MVGRCCVEDKRGKGNGDYEQSEVGRLKGWPPFVTGKMILGKRPEGRASPGEEKANIMNMVFVELRVVIFNSTVALLWHYLPGTCKWEVVSIRLWSPSFSCNDGSSRFASRLGCAKANTKISFHFLSKQWLAGHSGVESSSNELGRGEESSGISYFLGEGEACISGWGEILVQKVFS